MSLLEAEVSLLECLPLEWSHNALRKPNSPWKSHTYVFWPLPHLKSQPTTTIKLPDCDWGRLWMISAHSLWASPAEVECGSNERSLSGPNNIAYSSANTVIILSCWPLRIVGDIAKDNGTCLYLPDRHKCQRTVTPMAGWDVVKKTVSNQDPCSRRILGAHADEQWNPAGTQPCFPQHC